MIKEPVDRGSVVHYLGGIETGLNKLLGEWCSDMKSDKAFANDLRLAIEGIHQTKLAVLDNVACWRLSEKPERQ